MKALITGGTGFIGSHLTEYLLDKGVEVFALVRDQNNLKWLKGLDIHLLKGDLLSIPSLPTDIDYVFHAAGLTKSSKISSYYTVNQQGTASLLKALDSQNIFPKRVIFLSSVAASGPSTNGKPVRESDPPRPITPYGKSKLMGEYEALKFKTVFPIVILRIAAAFGPRDRDFLTYFNLVKRGILASLGRKERFYSLCYIKDLVNALYLCTQKDVESGGIFNIAHPNPCRWDDIGKATGKALRKKLIKVKVPVPLVYIAALFSDLTSKITQTPAVMNRHKFKEMRQEGWVADTKKAEEKLSFCAQYPLEEAIQETIDWYIKNNWL
jgi:nucleoside-diphosphate-sugar epimerase